MSAVKNRVIIDVDAGTDDVFALLVLLHAEKNGLVKIEAINCSMGNASLKDVTRNVVRVLEILNRTDVSMIYFSISDNNDSIEHLSKMNIWNCQSKF